MKKISKKLKTFKPKCLKIKSINRVIDYFGSIESLSSALKITTYAIYAWNKIPEKRAYQIQVITNNKIKAKDLL